MVVVSHLFFFFDKKFGEGVTRYESNPPSLELSISRQPLIFYNKSSKMKDQEKSISNKIKSIVLEKTICGF